MVQFVPWCARGRPEGASCLPGPGAHSECERIAGEHAEFDGEDACRCKDGYTEGDDGECVPAEAPSRGGAGARGGAVAGAAGGGQAIIKVDALCKEQYGPSSEFDRVDSCRCAASAQFRGGRCVAAGGAEEQKPTRRGSTSSQDAAVQR